MYDLLRSLILNNKGFRTLKETLSQPQYQNILPDIINQLDDQGRTLLDLTTNPAILGLLKQYGAKHNWELDNSPTISDFIDEPYAKSTFDSQGMPIALDHEPLPPGEVTKESQEKEDDSVEPPIKKQRLSHGEKRIASPKTDDINQDSVKKLSVEKKRVKESERRNQISQAIDKLGEEVYMSGKEGCKTTVEVINGAIELLRSHRLEKTRAGAQPSSFFYQPSSTEPWFYHTTSSFIMK